MNARKFNDLVNLAALFFLVAILFGLGSTIYFIAEYGWHIQPWNDAERICDKITTQVFRMAVALIGYGLVRILLLFAAGRIEIKDKTKV